jgi:hypothetical protein
VACPLAFALVLFGGAAGAQDKEADAERLFREGQKLLEERRFGEACPKFEQAYTKDRQLGTLINLAFCHKEQGATWYAWLEFREAEVKATELRRNDRRDFARQRLVELEKQLPKVIIDNPEKLPLTDVLVEDRKVWEAERGAPFAAEQGRRKFVFKAKGKKAATALIDVSGGSRVQHVAVPEMEDGSADPPPAPATATPPEAEGARTRDPGGASADSGGSTQRTLGWVALGVGSAAAVVGTITGLITLSSPCASGKACEPGDRSAAGATGTISDVSFVLGALGIGGGVALLLTAPPSSSPPSSQSAGRAGPDKRAVGVDVTPRLGLGFVGLSGVF